MRFGLGCRLFLVRTHSIKTEKSFQDMELQEAENTGEVPIKTQ